MYCDVKEVAPSRYQREHDPASVLSYPALLQMYSPNMRMPLCYVATLSVLQAGVRLERRQLLASSTAISLRAELGAPMPFKFYMTLGPALMFLQVTIAAP